MSGPGIDPVSEFRNRLRSKARRASAAALSGGVSAQTLGEAAEGSESYMDLQTDLISEEVDRLAAIRKHPPIACKKGCAHCCYLRAEASPPEIFRLVAWIKANMAMDDFAALRERLRIHKAKIEAMASSGEARAPTPCPMLVDEVCSVHPARPLTCRAFNSVDVGACILAKQNWREPAAIPGVAKQVHAAGAIIQGLSDAVTETGFADESLELPSALFIALEDETAPERWVAGEDAFAGARTA